MVSKANDTDPKQEDRERISLQYLAELTGFPVDYIKEELVLEDDELPIQDLRKSMMNFLDSTMKEIRE